MTVSMAAGWVIAIVIVFALFSWLAVVLRADTHPGWKHQSKLPKYEVTGGAFEAQDGGRQLMPRHGGRPMPTEEELASGSIPAQRAAAEKEELARARRVPAQRATAEQGATAATSGERAEEPHLTAGSKLRLGTGVRHSTRPGKPRHADTRAPKRLVLRSVGTNREYRRAEAT
jgi:hypothetical protein